MDQISLFSPTVSADALSELKQVFSSGWIGQGSLVDDFEVALCKQFHFPFAVAVSTNSAAIHLALSIIGVGSGDEVVTSALACTATNLPILWLNASPVFADIDPLSGNISPTDIEQKITAKTKAILCYHWGGNPCDMKSVHKIARKYSIPVIEDASDALGAMIDEKYIGQQSDFTVFSFQANQLLTTGEGGLLVLKKNDDYEAALRRRWYGIDRKNRKANNLGYYNFDISEIGFGYHFTNIQAAIGLKQLPHVAEKLKCRSKIFEHYQKEFADIPGLRLIEPALGSISSHQLCTILLESRDVVCRDLADAHIAFSTIHERNDAYSVFSDKLLNLPNLNLFEQKYICIPIHSELRNDQIRYISNTVRNSMKHVASNSFYEQGFARMEEISKSPRIIAVKNQLKRYVTKTKNISIFDFGCGDGAFTRQLGLLLKSRLMYGCDISQTAVRQAKALGVKAIVANTDDARLPYKDNSFDVVFCGSMVEIIKNPDFMLRELRRVLKSEGILVITFPNLCSWINRLAMLLGYLPYYYRVSTEYEIGKFMKSTSAAKSTGIIRLYSVKSLTALAELNNLRLLDTVGAAETALPKFVHPIDKIASRIPSMAAQVVCVFTK